MLSDNLRSFVAETRRGVLTTFRRSGGAQMSIVTCGPYREGVAFTTTARRAKLITLQRDPRCSLMVAQEDWWGYVVLEGRAELLSPETTDAVELRETLRDVYRVASGTEHSNWQEYDAAMLEQRRSAVIIVPEHIYGTRA